MSPHRRKNQAGMVEATQALAAADRDLQAAKARWPAIRALTGRAQVVANEARRERIQNHFGDLIDDAFREG